jgi:hypothetical protein
LKRTIKIPETENHSVSQKGGKMNKNSDKEDLPVGKMIVGLVMLLFSPIIIGFFAIIGWAIVAMFSTR